MISSYLEMCQMKDWKWCGIMMLSYYFEMCYDVLEMMQDNDAIFLFRNVTDEVLEMMQDTYLEMCHMLY